VSEQFISDFLSGELCFPGLQRGTLAKSAMRRTTFLLPIVNIDPKT
jgi:hypothetical protein